MFSRFRKMRLFYQSFDAAASGRETYSYILELNLKQRKLLLNSKIFAIIIRPQLKFLNWWKLSKTI